MRHLSGSNLVILTVSLWWLLDDFYLFLLCILKVAAVLLICNRIDRWLTVNQRVLAATPPQKSNFQENKTNCSSIRLSGFFIWYYKKNGFFVVITDMQYIHFIFEDYKKAVREKICWDNVFCSIILPWCYCIVNPEA